MHKLEKVLKWRAQLEQESAQALAACRIQRHQAEQQQDQLDTLAEDYRQQHLKRDSGHAHRYQQFLLFFAQLGQAVQAQQSVVKRLTVQESEQVARYVSCHKERLALEKLLEQREAAHKIAQARKDRRAQGPGRLNPMV